MKKIIPFIALLAIACGPDPTPLKFNFTVTNDTDLTLKLSCPSCQHISLAAGETKSFGTDTPFADYQIASVETTTKTIEYKETSTNTFAITAYYWEVQYRFTGATEKADVAFTNAEGGTTTFTDIQPAVNYQFKEFAGTQVQISAKLKSVGWVQVIIWHKDKQVASVREDAIGQTAIASATIE